MTWKDFREKFARGFFFAAAMAGVLAVALICWFIFSKGLPVISEIGWKNFLLGREWKPTATNPQFGIFPMIIGSIYVTIGAVIIGVPIGILTAVYLVYYCPKKVYHFIKPGINLLAGIPSVVYGLWALEVIVPWIRASFGGFGLSMLAAMILLGIMILPTVINLSEASLKAVPKSYYDGSIGLGASHERSVFRVMVPAAKSGLFSAVIMGIGRAIGETMAVKMVAGNQPIMPSSLTDGVRTLTSNIVIEMNYAGQGLHRDSLIATGAILFIFILIINIAFNLAKKGGKQA